MKWRPEDKDRPVGMLSGFQIMELAGNVADFIADRRRSALVLLVTSFGKEITSAEEKR